MTQNGNPPVQAPPRSGSLFDLLREIDREAEVRRFQSEILEFIQEALEKPEEPDSVPLSADDAALIEDAKAKVNGVIRSVDNLLGEIHTPLLRNELLLTICDALLFAHILGIYSKRPKSIQEWLEKIAKKRAAMLNAEKSAIVRSTKAQKKWQSLAEELMKQIREEEPKMSQEKVAEEIGSRWKASLVDLPGHRTLVRFISKVEGKKKLPPRAS